jgi:uncharacterized membrane protein
MVMNMLAAAIATYGLFANSPAVIIGAMIVAMLLGPITGVGLSLVDANMPLLVQSLSTLVAGALGVVVVAGVLGLVHHEMSWRASWAWCTTRCGSPTRSPSERPRTWWT